MIGTVPVRANSISTGCSSRQATHHDAQTLSNQTWPFMAAGPKVRAGTCSCAKVNAGADLSMSGDGTSRRLRHSPAERSAPNTTKRPSGTNSFLFTAGAGVRGAFGPCQADLGLRYGRIFSDPGTNTIRLYVGVGYRF